LMMPRLPVTSPRRYNACLKSCHASGKKSRAGFLIEQLSFSYQIMKETGGLDAKAENPFDPVGHHSVLYIF
jgi:hypothetical protein